MIDQILPALLHLAEPAVFGFLVFGVIIGLVVGAMPGLNDSITLAVLVPITFAMPGDLAFPLLVGIYCSACFGGSFPAILLKIPGTASSVVTAIDGNAMARKGQGGLALGIATYSSVFGGITSALVLLLCAPFLAEQALRFGPPEYFALALLGLSTVIGMATGNAVRSTIACVLGLLIATIGFSPQSGYPRFTFDEPWLYDGLPLVPMLIGLFGIASLLDMAEEAWVRRRNPASAKAAEVATAGVRFRDLLLPASMIRRLLPTWVQASAIGNVIGILPGAGMLMAIYMAYGRVARRFGPEAGTGLPEGVAAPEAANNSVVASSMVPLLSLGIPGNSTSALFLGALLIQGLRPGPSLFTDSPDIAYLIVVAFVVANILMFPLGLAMARAIPGLVARIPQGMLGAAVALLCIAGAYSVANSTFGVVVALGFGIFGYLMNKLHVPLSPLILGVVLEPVIERSLYQSLSLSGNSPWIFFERPISGVLMVAAIAFVAWPLIGGRITRRRKA
ncbi:tripartite tricarboxylate transporter permease [uncultured Tistrella sp.]|uniref:tripartite tricarboxylate transporter permease n=1 Tax=Tistrella mobilis TaxID=171437 RepID=UPI000C093F5C|nr:tripartite tricarboxylate transporter permease [uncultured Tistrella sp.]MAM75331.1 C4-dicarboxylate ABC transporter [Tistrella sp.]